MRGLLCLFILCIITIQASAFNASLLSDGQVLKYIDNVPLVTDKESGRNINDVTTYTYYIGFSDNINNNIIKKKLAYYMPRILTSINILSVKATEKDLYTVLDILKNYTNVEYINRAMVKQDNWIDKGFGNTNLLYEPNDPYYNKQWYLNNNSTNGFDLKYTEFSRYKQTQKLYKTLKSKEPVIALIDAGFYIDKDEMNDRIWLNSKEIPDNGIDDDYNGYIDDYKGVDTNPNHGFCMPDLNKCIDYFIKYKSFRHGLAMSSLIGAKSDNDKYIVGLAPDDIKILPISAESDNWSDVGHYIEAYDYILNLKNSGVNIIAVNMSISGKYDPSEEKIVQKLAEDDVLIIAASGNDNVNIDRHANNYYPAALASNMDNVISVLSLSRNGVKSYFSNYGNKNISIYMPGEKIATLYIDTNRFGVADSSGTSQAAAIMSGIIANAYWLYPNLSMIELKNKIIKNSKIVNYYYGTNLNSITLMDLLDLQ